jgi:hypothetical protein
VRAAGAEKRTLLLELRTETVALRAVLAKRAAELGKLTL